MSAKDEVKKEVFEAVEELSSQTGMPIWNYIEGAYNHYKKVVGQSGYREANS